MRLIEIRDANEFHLLRPAWTQLLQSTGTSFQTWEWADAWWSAYGGAYRLRILLAYDDSTVLRGIAPLYSKVVRKYRQSVPILALIGDGSNDSDYLDFIVSPGWEASVIPAFYSYWTEQGNHREALVLNEMPATSPSRAVLQALAARDNLIWTEADVPCASVQLPAGWEEYLNLLRPRFRTKVRSVLRNLETRGDIQFGFCNSTEQIERLLPILFELHKKRWAQDAKPGVFGSTEKCEFYRRLSPLFLDRGSLRFSWLQWNDIVLACQYGFVHGNTYFHLQEGYEPASEHWSVGIGLRAWSIRELLKTGIREYDFLGGVSRHKSDWGAETKQSRQIVVARSGYQSTLLCRAPKWETSIRETVGRMVPEAFMSARRARLERQALDSFRASENGQPVRLESKWIRQAVAQCYFRLGLPSATRSLRERYQLSISPTLSLSRRQQSSGRILYYHRVNDNANPFLPSLSIEAFDRHMKFVSEHYRVVNLTGMLEHLASGNTEPVVAITFDDGYQDNYDNAFPILQRYGLPATVFLATGSLDSREPLWFERLALAIKDTPKAFVDLDIALPQRFWTRTPAERLTANDKIFRLLRTLTDSKRREGLAEVLRQLGHTFDASTNQMLTWDQVRVMQSNRIDFGGHTVSHPFLAKLTREQVSWEVSECKRRIEEELQLPVRYFAYPNGREEDFDPSNKDLIRQAGYEAAMSTIWGLNYRSTDQMELRRGGPWEIDPALFAYKLDWYQWVND